MTEGLVRSGYQGVKEPSLPSEALAPRHGVPTSLGWHDGAVLARPPLPGHLWGLCCPRAGVWLRKGGHLRAQGGGSALGVAGRREAGAGRWRVPAASHGGGRIRLSPDSQAPAESRPQDGSASGRPSSGPRTHWRWTSAGETGGGRGSAARRPPHLVSRGASASPAPGTAAHSPPRDARGRADPLPLPALSPPR